MLQNLGSHILGTFPSGLDTYIRISPPTLALTLILVAFEIHTGKPLLGCSWPFAALYLWVSRFEAVAATNGRATILLPEGWRRPWYHPWSFPELRADTDLPLPRPSWSFCASGPYCPTAPEVMLGSSGTVQMMGRPSGMPQRPRKRHGLGVAILLIIIHVAGSPCSSSVCRIEL